MDLRSAYPGYPGYAGAYSPAASMRRGSGSGDASPVDARLGGRFVQPHAFYNADASSALKGLAKWHVSIPTVETKQPDGTAYYNLAVRNDFMSWVAPYRYSAVNDFKLKLERRFPHLKLPPFPPKSYALFGTHGPEFLDARRRGLETFLQAEKGEQARQQFVAQNQARSLVSPAPSPSMESYDDVAEDSFLLPNFPRNAQIPEVITLQSGEECFVAPLINEMKVNIEYLWKLKKKMSGKDIDIKLHMLEDERGKIDAACRVLEGERRVLEGQLLEDRNVRSLAVLHTWLEFSKDKIKLALEWANHAEESLLLELSPKITPTAARAPNSDTMVKEDLLVDLSGPAPAPSAVPYPLQAPPLQMHPGAMYPPYYYPPPSYALQPPGSGSGVPQPYYAMPQHHVIPSAPGYPMMTPGYPQPPLSGNMMGAAGSGVLMPPTSGNYPPMSSFGPLYPPVSMQLPTPVSSGAQQQPPQSHQPSQQHQHQQQQQQHLSYQPMPSTSTSSSALAYPGSTTSAPSYDAASSYTSGTTSSTTQTPPQPQHQPQQSSPPALRTQASALSPSLNVSSSFSPLPLRIGALSPIAASSTAPQSVPQESKVMEQQYYDTLAPLRILTSSRLAEEKPQEQRREEEEEENGSAPPALPSSFEDPFTASVSFNAAYPADSFSAAPYDVGSPQSSASFFSSSPATTSASSSSSSFAFSSSTSTTTTSSTDSHPVASQPAYPTLAYESTTATTSSSASPFTEARSPPPPPVYAFASAQSYAQAPEHNAAQILQQQQHYYAESTASALEAPSPSPSAGSYTASAPAFADNAQVMIGRPTHAGAKRTKDLGEKIQSYEQKAEKLVVLAVERPDQLNETEKKMKKLINKIKADQEALIAQFARRNDAEAVSQRLANILTYIQENYDLMKRFRSLYAEDQLNVFEERMYALLSEANEIKGHDMDEATKFHQKMTTLMREMALYHSVLRKKLEEEQKVNGAAPADLGEVNKNHLLNRLEDLQENMADFEHNFCTQYKVKRDFGDRAKQMFKQMKVKEAQQKHNVAQDSLYEL